MCSEERELAGGRGDIPADTTGAAALAEEEVVGFGHGLLLGEDREEWLLLWPRELGKGFSMDVDPQRDRFFALSELLSLRAFIIT